MFPWLTPEGISELSKETTTRNGLPNVRPPSTLMVEVSPNAVAGHWVKTPPQSRAVPGPSWTVTGISVTGAMTLVACGFADESACRFSTVCCVDFATKRPLKFGSDESVVVADANQLSPWLVPPSVGVEPPELKSKVVVTDEDAEEVVRPTTMVTVWPGRTLPRAQLRGPVPVLQEPALVEADCTA